jgi:hypothetical protein
MDFTQGQQQEEERSEYAMQALGAYFSHVSKIHVYLWWPWKLYQINVILYN